MRGDENDMSNTETEPTSSADDNDTKERRPKTGELVARRIVRELGDNDIEAGTVLDVETDLMKRLGVSRASLREGVRILELVGVVESRRGRTGGLVVQEPNEEDFARTVTLFLEFAECTYAQLMAAYGEILALMARQAASSASEDENEEIRSALAEFEEMPLEDQVRTTIVHDTMVKAIDNPIWRIMAASLRLVIRQRFDFLLVPEHNWPAVANSVRRLATAVIERNVELADQLARKQNAAWFDVAEREQPGLLEKRITWDA